MQLLLTVTLPVLTAIAGVNAAIPAITEDRATASGDRNFATLTTCTTHDDCTNASEGQCDSGTCAPCTHNDHCTDTYYKRCLTGECVRCLNNNHCKEEYGEVCHTTNECQVPCNGGHCEVGELCSQDTCFDPNSREKLVVLSGKGNGSDATTEEASTNGIASASGSLSWSAGANLSITPEEYLDAPSAVGNDHLYYFGGPEDPNEQNEPMKSVYARSLIEANPSWTQLTDMPAARRLGAACYAGGELWYSGGSGSPIPGEDAFVWSLDVENGATSWVTRPSLPHELHQHTMTFANGYILVVGGDNGGLSDKVYMLRHNAQSSDLWETLPSLSTARESHSTVFAGDALYVMAGLGAPASSPVTSTEVLDMSSSKVSDWTWSAGPTMYTGFHKMGAAYVAKKDVIVAVGGKDGSQGVSKKTQKLILATSTPSWEWETDMDNARESPTMEYTGACMDSRRGSCAYGFQYKTPTSCVWSDCPAMRCDGHTCPSNIVHVADSETILCPTGGCTDQLCCETATCQSENYSCTFGGTSSSLRKNGATCPGGACTDEICCDWVEIERGKRCNPTDSSSVKNAGACDSFADSGDQYISWKVFNIVEDDLYCDPATTDECTCRPTVSCDTPVVREQANGNYWMIFQRN